MKNKKTTRLISVLLSILVTFSLLPTVAFAADTAAYTVGSGTAQTGQQVSIPISLTNGIENGFVAASILINYDTANLTLADAELGSALSASGAIAFNTSGSKSNITFYSSDETLITNSGEMLILTFTVNDTAADGKYTIGIEKSPSDTCWFYGSGWVASDVVPTITAGTITVGSESSTPTQLTAPTLSDTAASTASDSITLTAPDASAQDTSATVQYRMSADSGSSYGDWQDSATFSDLTASTTYYFQAMYVAADTTNWSDSEASTAVSIATTDVSIAPADFTDSVYTISAGGTYVLDTRANYAAAANADGWWIQIATTEQVTIIGTGCDLENGLAYSGMSITGTVAGVDLTVENLYIDSASLKSCYTSHAVSTKDGEEDITDICNVLNFTGTGNKLTIKGTNDFEATTSGAAIHVGPAADLTIDGDGALYLYKSGAWTCIGGNGCEANGKITINGGSIFAKGTKMGAVIGSGSYCGDIPGDITINGGTLNLMSNARGASIGTGAQDSGATNHDNFPKSTGDVYINGGLINLNVDFTGAAIGQADAAAKSTQFFAIPGNLYVTGGSIRTYIDKNAQSSWNAYVSSNVTTYGVYPVAITADKTNGGGKPVYMLALDTAQAGSEGTYTVEVDGKEYYSGGLYSYRCAKEETESASIAYTYQNWIAGTDTNLYLYLTGEDHTITLNGTDFSYIWDSATSSFSLETAAEALTPDYSWYTADGGTSEASPYQISNASQLLALANLVNGTYDPAMVSEDTAAAKTFEGKYIQLTDNIVLDDDGKYIATPDVEYGVVNYRITTTQYAARVSTRIWTPIGTGTSTSANTVSTANYFAGTFDGNGKTVSGLYTDGSAKVQGLFGCVSGTVKNLTVSGCVMAHSIAGGIAAYLNGGTIENCVNNAVVFTDGGTTPNGNIENGLKRAGADGGMVGRASGTEAAPFAVIDCVNNGSIIGANSNQGGRTGGMVGLVDSKDDYGSISDCLNTGFVDAYQYAGGIVGMIYSTHVPIELCGNTADIWGHSPGSTYVGGISSSCNSDIYSCYNTGNVRIQMDGNDGNKAACAGGIVSNLGGAKVTSCYFTGTLSYGGYATFFSKDSVGVIAGSGYGSAGNSNLVNCCTTVNWTTDDLKYVTDNSITNALALKTADEMKSADTVAQLNANGNVYETDGDNYPILFWQNSDHDGVTVNVSKATENADTMTLSAVGTVPYGTKITLSHTDVTGYVFNNYTVNSTNYGTDYYYVTSDTEFGTHDVPESFVLSLSASADTVGTGKTVDVALNVSHNSTATAFNALYATVTYDTDKFSYDAENSTLGDFKVEDSSTPGTLTISKFGDETAIGNALVTLRFTALEAGGDASFTITSGNVDVAANTLKDAAAAILPENATAVTVNPTVCTLTDFIPNYKLLTVTGFAGTGNVFTYNGTAMLWSDKYGDSGAWCTVVPSTETADSVKAEVSTAAGEKTSVAYSGDVNQTGKVDINDAQLVWAIYNGSAPSGVTVRMQLEADKNDDGTVNLLDAAAVVFAMN